MACNNYLPRFQDQINGSDPMGGLNCTCYSAAMAADYHSCGDTVPTGEKVRDLTNDNTGGTTLAQVDRVLDTYYGINLDTRVGSSRLTWTQFENYINAGRGAILQGSYTVIHGTRFEGDTTFRGNHAMFIPPNWAAMDPLCDGRRPGIYKWNNETYPRDLLKRFAGTLEIVPGKRLGVGLVWASLTRDNTVSYRVSIHPTPPSTKQSFWRYYVDSQGYITKREAATTTGFSANSTPPKLYPAKPGQGFLSKSLVRLVSGSRKDWYVATGWAKEI